MEKTKPNTLDWTDWGSGVWARNDGLRKVERRCGLWLCFSRAAVSEEWAEGKLYRSLSTAQWMCDNDTSPEAEERDRAAWRAVGGVPAP